MIRIILRRLIATIPVVFGVSTLTFLLIHFVPGDPVDIMLGETASAADKAALRAALGLERPLLEQYTSFLGNLLHLDLGTSLMSRQPVLDEILARLPATIELTLAAISIAVLAGIPLGVIAAIQRGRWADRAALIFGLLGISVPNFWLAPMLILVFSIQLGWLPVSERGGIESLVLPGVSLGLALSSILMRMTRASMLEVINEDYIRTARAKGLSSFSLYFKHGLRNALMPVITILGLQFGSLLTGAVITETIFDWPGIGTLFFQSIQQRNYPLVQGCVLFISMTYVFVNLLTDLAYLWANPKLRPA
ncbi:MAG TPA: nickel ABC transporter permease [Bdellovibrionales bacterium]|nr:nickel ABC transporter permease [Bdellovibrionales bacterium]